MEAVFDARRDQLIWTPIGSSPVRCRKFPSNPETWRCFYEDHPHPALRCLAGRRSRLERLWQERRFRFHACTGRDPAGRRNRRSGCCADTGTGFHRRHGSGQHRCRSGQRQHRRHGSGQRLDRRALICPGGIDISCGEDSLLPHDLSVRKSKKSAVARALFICPSNR